MLESYQITTRRHRWQRL